MAIWKVIFWAYLGSSELLASYDFTKSIGELLPDLSGNDNALVAGNTLSDVEGTEPLYTSLGLYFLSSSWLSFPPNAVRLNFLNLTSTFHLMTWFFPISNGVFFQVDAALSLSFSLSTIEVVLNSAATTQALSNDASRWVYLVLEISEDTPTSSTLTVWEDDLMLVNSPLDSAYTLENYNAMTLGGGFKGYVYELKLSSGNFDGSIEYIACTSCSDDCVKSTCVSVCQSLETMSVCGQCDSCDNLCTDDQPLCLECSEGCSSCYEDACIDIPTNYCSPNDFDGLTCDWTSCELEGCGRCGSNNACFTCNDGYTLLQDTGLCIESSECPEGYFAVVGFYAVCFPCISNCKECANSSECLVCTDSTYLTESQTCSNCPSTCSTCTSLTECQTCQNGHYLSEESFCETCSSDCASCITDDKCTDCKSGYYLDSGQCSACLEFCLECEKAAACDLCIEGFELTAMCTCECPEHFTFDKEIGGCILEPLSAVGYLADEYILIAFSRNLVSPVTISNIELSYFLPSFDYAEPHIEISLVDGCALTLTTSSLPQDVTGYYIKFSGLHAEVSVQDEEVVELIVEASQNDLSQVTQEEDPEEDEFESVAGPVATYGGAGLGTTLAAGVVGISLSMYDYSALWSFVQTAQIFYLMPVQNLPVPDSVVTLWMSFGAQFFELPNLGELVGADEGKKSPGNWSLVEFETTSLLMNTGELLYVTFITAGLLPFFALGYFACHKWRKLKKFFKKRVKDYKWCYFLRLGLEGYIEFVAASLITLGAVRLT